MGLEKDGEIVTGVVFNCFTGNNVEITVAGSVWTKGLLKEVGRYVFDQMRCDRMTITTDQQSVVSLALRMGGQVEGNMRDFYGKGRNASVVGILANDYRFRPKGNEPL